MWSVRVRWLVVLVGVSLLGALWLSLSSGVSENTPSGQLKVASSRPLQKENKGILKIRRIVLLSEYICGDYAVAVSPTGEILDSDEFAEMKEFTGTIRELYQEVENPSPEIAQKMSELEALVLAKTPPALIEEKALELSESLKVVHKLQSQLSAYPDLASGRHHFEKHCSSCHGLRGNGETPLAATLKIPPRNLLEKEFVEKLSPSKVHNTLKLGIPDTGMISYEGILSEREMWDVSFYVTSLPFQGEKDSSGFIASPLLREVSWQDLADKRLGELREEVVEVLPNLNEKELHYQLVALRNLHFEESERPLLDESSSKKKSSGALESLAYTRAQIHEAHESLKQKDFSAVSHKILDAYLEGFEDFERELKILDPEKLKSLERDFMALRGLASRDPDYEALSGGLKNLDLELAQLEKTFSRSGKRQKLSFFSDVLSSATIILREGVEAFLIVMALLALVNNLGVRRAKIWIHSAWILAILLGFVTYYLMNKVFELSGASRELLEAFFTGFAVLMLFYTGFWLLSQSGSRRWNQYVRGGSKEELSQGNLFAFFGLAFVAVYREAAETVLFYQALLSTAGQVSSVVLGFFVGVLMLLALCLGILYYNIKIPMNKFFKLTSGLMFLLSFILMGKAVYELIEANYISPTPWAFVPHFEALGLYPFRETSLAQFLLLTATGILLYRFRQKAKVSSKEAPQKKEATSH